MNSIVLLAKNLKEVVNLIKGSVGYIEEVTYVQNESQAINLPMCVLIDFGEVYEGQTFPLNESLKNWILFNPTKTTL